MIIFAGIQTYIAKYISKGMKTEALVKSGNVALT